VIDIIGNPHRPAHSASSPIVVGGVGGSGTGLIAEMVQKLGIYIGPVLNPQKDNLFFTLLFKRPLWFHSFPDQDQIKRAIQLFQRAMLSGLKHDLSQSDRDYIELIVRGLDNATKSIGVHRKTAIRLTKSRKPDLKNWIGWGWKEPNSHIFLPYLAPAFSDIKYIHVIRHGLDMAISKNQQQAINWSRYICEENFGKEANTPSRSLDYWIAANRRAIEFGTMFLKENFLLIHYEQFCINPDHEIRRLADFLGIEFSVRKLRSLKRHISPNTIGRHRGIDINIFSKTQIAAVRDLGFEVSGP